MVVEAAEETGSLTDFLQARSRRAQPWPQSGFKRRYVSTGVSTGDRQCFTPLIVVEANIEEASGGRD